MSFKYATGGVVSAPSFVISEAKWEVAKDASIATHPPMDLPPWQAKWTAERVARAALMECNRPDLAWYLFSYDEPNFAVHFDQSSATYNGVNPGFFLAPKVSDVALIEKAMSIGFRAAGLVYGCTPCENIFQALGVSHLTDLSSSA